VLLDPLEDGGVVRPAAPPRGSSAGGPSPARQVWTCCTRASWYSTVRVASNASRMPCSSAAKRDSTAAPKAGQPHRLSGSA
jgi:hypothetical protein